MKYIIFGTGRVGNNIDAWLTGLGHQVTMVNHNQADHQTSQCKTLVKQADIVVAALPDAGLTSWFQDWQGTVGQRPAIHFSGALHLQGMHGFHPLYSFPHHIIPATEMHALTFACPKGGPDFACIFPNATNPTFLLADQDRAHYHALAVLSGNFTAHLWNQTAREFERHYGLSSTPALAQYFNSVLARFAENPTTSLTGPLARQDSPSVKANLKALEENHDLTDLYKAFLASAWPGYKK